MCKINICHLGRSHMFDKKRPQTISEGCPKPIPHFHRFLVRFWVRFGMPREEKKLSFLCNGLQKSTSGLFGKGTKTRLRKLLDLGTLLAPVGWLSGYLQMVWKRYPKSVENGARRDPPGTPFWSSKSILAGYGRAAVSKGGPDTPFSSVLVEFRSHFGTILDWCWSYFEVFVRSVL